VFLFFFSSRRRHTRWPRDWSSDVCSSDLPSGDDAGFVPADGNQLKCADAVGKELGKLAAAAIKCHVKMADAFFNGKDFDENICEDRKSTRLNSSHVAISYAVFCLKKKKKK